MYTNCIIFLHPNPSAFLCLFILIWQMKILGHIYQSSDLIPIIYHPVYWGNPLNYESRLLKCKGNLNP